MYFVINMIVSRYFIFRLAHGAQLESSNILKSHVSVSKIGIQ